MLFRKREEKDETAAPVDVRTVVRWISVPIECTQIIGELQASPENQEITTARHSNEKPTFIIFICEVKTVFF